MSYPEEEIVKKGHSISVDDVLRSLDTSLQGLTSEEAKTRLEKYGPNELKTGEKASPLKIFLSQFKNILIIILIAATLISLVTGHDVDAIVIFAIVLVSSTLGFYQEYRAEKALEALKRMLSPNVTVIRDSKEVSIPLREVVPGDILVLKEGDKVPADARLIDVINLRVNEASLTGESVPVVKETSPLPENTPVSERRNMVFSGTQVVGGKGKAVVIATGMNTEFGKIARNVATVKKEETPLEKRAREIGKWLGMIALTISAAMIIIGVWRGIPLLQILLFSVALAVAAVPEALPAVVTGSLAIGMYRMAKRNALVRRMPAVETLGSVTVICSDKTGTLTKGEMTVRRIYTLEKRIEVTGVGYEPRGSFHIDGDNETGILRNQGFDLLMKCSLLCNDTELIREDGKWRIKGDPTEGALLVVAVKAGLQPEEVRKQYPRINEVPFSSERKLMTTVHSTPEGDKIFCMKGAPEKVLEKCTHIHELNGVKELTEERREEILRVNDEMAGNGLRVLGLAYKRAVKDTDILDEKTVESNMIFLGLVGMIDPPREEAIKAVETCKQVGIKPIMITGDHKLTAISIAKELGIYREGNIVLTGEELEKISDKELEEIVEKVTVYARVSPEDKLKIVKAWKRRGHIVAMTGDGVNDAPALKHADIGVAMGITGTEVTKETADMVLVDDNFATIVSAIELGRWIYDNIKKYLAFLLQANLVEIIMLSATVLMGLPLPLLPVQILYVNLATDGLPAIALGVSPSDPDIMKRPPRNPKESIFTKDVKIFLLRTVVIGVPLIIWVFLSSLPYEDIARTRVFISLIFFELVLALTCRSLNYTIFEARPHRFLLAAVFWETILLLALITFPITRQALGIVEPQLTDFLMSTGICLIILVSTEATKLLLRRNNFAYQKKSGAQVA
ncbi:MAG: cation-translocating P-type ATPase [Candidatus Bathyarchaeia archaeon]|nr:cation-translocating P-type ATPase [Candidatus Brockarchaeota archaeon]